MREREIKMGGRDKGDGRRKSEREGIEGRRDGGEGGEKRDKKYTRIYMGRSLGTHCICTKHMYT